MHGACIGGILAIFKYIIWQDAITGLTYKQLEALSLYIYNYAILHNDNVCMEYYNVKTCVLLSFGFL